jgi:translation initiation factor 2D
MIPGMLIKDPVIKDQIVAVCSAENGELGYPFMVGLSQIDSNSYPENGKGVLNIHTCYDKLWEFGSKTEFQSEINVSMVLPNNEPWVVIEHEILKPEAPSSSSLKNIINRTMTNSSINSRFSSFEDIQLELLSVPSTNESYQLDTLEVYTIEMDSLFRTTVLNCLHFKCEDRMLPISASTFYSSLMIPSRPAGTIIDIKQSSFKKVLLFLNPLLVVKVFESL